MNTTNLSKTKKEILAYIASRSIETTVGDIIDSFADHYLTRGDIYAIVNSLIEHGFLRYGYDKRTFLILND